MQIKKRLAVLISIIIIGLLFVCYTKLHKHHLRKGYCESTLKSYYDIDHYENVDKNTVRPPSRPLRKFDNKKCRMETCFNYTRCRHQFMVYLYPVLKNDGLNDEDVTIDDHKKKFNHFLYEKFLKVLNQSRLLTRDPNKACLFVLSIDTLDRDHLSEDYVIKLDKRISKLPYWNHGENHVIFNLYSGTWPNYDEDDLKFNYEKAILARASMSVRKSRAAFDISIPLFHKHHPDRGLKPSGSLNTNQFPINSTYLVSFKGKRYVYGIGSKTRNTLHHLHNGNDCIILTTCRHGKNWKQMSDDRCDLDNEQYNQYDYETLMENSKFCLIPRGRRLGSFRFLEALKSGCIPVILSNTWMLPFAEVIDWHQAVIWADERLLLQIPHMLRDISDEQIFRMKRQTQFLWDQYFSSIDQIIHTTFEIIRDRIPNQQYTRNRLQWNRYPGALYTPPGYSNHLPDYPFYFAPIQPKFTAIIIITPTKYLKSALFKLMRNLISSRFLAMIVLLWNQNQNQNHNETLPNWNLVLNSNVTIRTVTTANMSHRFDCCDFIESDAVLQLDDNVIVTGDEIDFAFHVWTQNADRIVGYHSRSHYWNDVQNQWCYSSKLSNEYSIVLLNFAFYHRFYNYLYQSWLKPLLETRHGLTGAHECGDIAINFLVSHITQTSPIKVVQKRSYVPYDVRGLLAKQNCLNEFLDVFGYMALVKSRVRFDPVLFKDSVSNFRKKYKQLEMAPNIKLNLFVNNF